MTTVITFDIDWAPDWAIRLCHDLCRASDVPATFYATHGCDPLIDLRSDPTMEVGIHPNFLPASSHGSDLSSVLKHCQELVPEAVSMRTHGLYQSTLMFAAVIDHCPSIIADVSLFLPGHARLQPTLLHLNRSRPLVRLPYWWEDDIAACTPGCTWDAPTPDPSELRIFDFHPVHVALNMRSLESYLNLKRALDKPLWRATPRDFEPFVNSVLPGTKTLLEKLLSVKDVAFSRVADVARDYLSEEQRPCG